MYCGSDIPNDFYSIGKRLYLKFKSDAEIEKTGFSITASLTKACHRNYTNSQGRILVNELNDCESYISVSTNTTISLYFAVFSIYPIDYKYVCTDDTAPLMVNRK